MLSQVPRASPVYRLRGRMLRASPVSRLRRWMEPRSPVRARKLREYAARESPGAFGPWDGHGDRGSENRCDGRHAYVQICPRAAPDGGGVPGKFILILICIVATYILCVALSYK